MAKDLQKEAETTELKKVDETQEKTGTIKKIGKALKKHDMKHGIKVAGVTVVAFIAGAVFGSMKKKSDSGCAEEEFNVIKLTPTTDPESDSDQAM